MAREIRRVQQAFADPSSGLIYVVTDDGRLLSGGMKLIGTDYEWVWTQVPVYLEVANG